MVLRVPPEWETEFTDSGALVFVADDGVDRWESVRAELTKAFELSRHAAQNNQAIIYVVHNDDLLGRRGPERAMVATGLLSAARTAAVELAKAGVPVNVLAIEDGTSPAAVSRWAELLAAQPTPTGELIHLGAGHIGKALA